MLPRPRLPFFVPAFFCGVKQYTRHEVPIDGIDHGVAHGFVAIRSGLDTVLVRGKGETAGEIVWVDPLFYDEAVQVMDARFGSGLLRTLGQVRSARGDCSVDCWIYTAINHPRFTQCSLQVS